MYDLDRWCRYGSGNLNRIPARKRYRRSRDLIG
jgi:hypothetical protein